MVKNNHWLYLDFASSASSSGVSCDDLVEVEDLDVFSRPFNVFLGSLRHIEAVYGTKNRAATINMKDKTIAEDKTSHTV